MDVESGQRILIARKLLKLTQRKAATEYGVKPWVVSAIERGDHIPTYEQMNVIGSFLAQQLGRRIEDFFPNYISRDGKNPGPGSPLPDSAGNRSNDDVT